MKIEIKNKYANARVFQQPPCKPIPKDTFIKYLREGVECIYPYKLTKANKPKKNDSARIVHNINLTYVKVLKRYLDEQKVTEVIPDENFFTAMWKRLTENLSIGGKKYSLLTLNKVSRSIRKLVNEYMYPRGIIKRKILLGIERFRYDRLFKLTKSSQDAIIAFEDHGRVVKAYPAPLIKEGKDGEDSEVTEKYIKRVTDKLLLPYTKDGKIRLALISLEAVGKDGFEKTTKEDVEKFKKYCDDRKLKKKNDYLADVATFYANIKSDGFIKNNPFADVPLKKDGKCVRKDFLPQQEINKLFDFSTLDFTDKRAVRDRAMALVMYDWGIRIEECLMLECSDLHKDTTDGEYFIVFREEAQKGNKDENMHYVLWPKTKELLEYYLKKVRKQFNPKTNHLFVSRYGKKLGSQHFRKRFDAMCEKLNIKTFYGNKPTPHCLRHSLATLNVELIGARIPLYELKRRMRHKKMETLEYHYIHNNPVLNRQKFDRIRQNFVEETTNDILNKFRFEDIENWLSGELGVDHKTINKIKVRHKMVFSEKNKFENKNKNGIIYLPETEAEQRLEHLNVPIRSLRRYCEREGLAVDGTGQWKYSEEFINDVAKNFRTKQQIMQSLSLSHAGFHRLVKRENLKKIRLGHVVIVKNDRLI